MINRWRKLSCKLGHHWYRDANLEVTFIAEDYDALTYRMENKCIYCGKAYCEIVRIPLRGD